MADTTIEYEVAWFPQGGPDQTKTFTILRAAEKFANARAREGAVPILSQQTVVRSDWAIVRNYASERPADG